MDLSPKQQTSEAIRQAETILVTTGQHPSVDQVAAVVALAAILRKFGKKLSAVISDSLPPSASLLDTNTIERSLSGLRDFVVQVDLSKAEVDKLRYEVDNGKLNIFVTPFKGGFEPSDVGFDYGDFHYDLAIILGVPTRARIDRIYEQNAGLFEKIPVVNLDFHRSNENYGAVNLIEPNASSLCEMLVALAESLQGGIIDADISTALLTGIMASTDRFTASHTTPKSLTVAAQMMAAGARQQAVVKALYRGDATRSGDAQRGSASSRGQSGSRPSGENARANDNRSQAGQVRRGQEPSGSERGPREVQAERKAPQAGSLNDGRQLNSRHDLVERAPQLTTVSPVPEATPVAEVTRLDENQSNEFDPNGFAPDESIISPSHIEMSTLDESPVPVGDTVSADAPPMADFAAAAEVLARQREEPAERTS